MKDSLDTYKKTETLEKENFKHELNALKKDVVKGKAKEKQIEKSRKKIQINREIRLGASYIKKRSESKNLDKASVIGGKKLVEGNMRKKGKERGNATLPEEMYIVAKEIDIPTIKYVEELSFPENQELRKNIKEFCSVEGEVTMEHYYEYVFYLTTAAYAKKAHENGQATEDIDISTGSENIHIGKELIEDVIEFMEHMHDVGTIETDDIDIHIEIPGAEKAFQKYTDQVYHGVSLGEIYKIESMQDTKILGEIQHQQQDYVEHLGGYSCNDLEKYLALPAQEKELDPRKEQKNNIIKEISKKWRKNKYEQITKNNYKEGFEKPAQTLQHTASLSQNITIAEIEYNQAHQYELHAKNKKNEKDTATITLSQKHGTLHIDNLEERYLPGEKHYQLETIEETSVPALKTSVQQQMYLHNVLQLMGVDTSTGINEHQRGAFRLFSQIGSKMTAQELETINSLLKDTRIIKSLQDSNIGSQTQTSDQISTNVSWLVQQRIVGEEQPTKGYIQSETLQNLRGEDIVRNMYGFLDLIISPDKESSQLFDQPQLDTKFGTGRFRLDETDEEGIYKIVSTNNADQHA